MMGGLTTGLSKFYMAEVFSGCPRRLEQIDVEYYKKAFKKSNGGYGKRLEKVMGDLEEGLSKDGGGCGSKVRGRLQMAQSKLWRMWKTFLFKTIMDLAKGSSQVMGDFVARCAIYNLNPKNEG